MGYNFRYPEKPFPGKPFPEKPFPEKPFFPFSFEERKTFLRKDNPFTLKGFPETIVFFFFSFYRFLTVKTPSPFNSEKTRKKPSCFCLYYARFTGTFTTYRYRYAKKPGFSQKNGGKKQGNKKIKKQKRRKGKKTREKDRKSLLGGILPLYPFYTPSRYGEKGFRILPRKTFPLLSHCKKGYYPVSFRDTTPIPRRGTDTTPKRLVPLYPYTP